MYFLSCLMILYQLILTPTIYETIYFHACQLARTSIDQSPKREKKKRLLHGCSNTFLFDDQQDRCPIIFFSLEIINTCLVDTSICFVFIRVESSLSLFGEGRGESNGKLFKRLDQIQLSLKEELENQRVAETKLPGMQYRAEIENTNYER